MIKTSIIVPVYNTAEYLWECFASISAQTQKEIEVIAINDGSTDNSLQILEEIKKDHPEMIIFSQKNMGLGSARNQGIELANGEFIYFLDSDDCLIDNAMDVCYECAKNHNLDMVMFDAESFGDLTEERQHAYDRAQIIKEREYVFSGEEFANKYWLKRFCPNAFLFYSASRLIKNHGLRFLDKIYYEDNEFYCKIMAKAQRTMYIPQKLYRRRYRESSIATSQFDRFLAESYLMMIQAVDRQYYGVGMETLMHEIKHSFVNTLLRLCQEEHLMADLSFAQSLYTIALGICGGNLEEIDSYRDIELLSRICDMAYAEGCNDREKMAVQERKERIIQRAFAEIPLNIVDKCVGVYGLGKTTQTFLKMYQEYVGEIKARLVFIESFSNTNGKQYEGYEVFQVTDIGELPLECIVIPSSKYEEDMCNAVREIYGGKFRMIRLKTDRKLKL